MKELLNEQEKRLEKKFDNIDEKFDNIDKKFENVDKKLATQTKELRKDYSRMGKFILDEVDKKLSVMAEVQDEHTKQLKKLDPIMEMVAKNSEDIEIMKGMLRRKVDIDEFNMLEKRVMILEKKVRM